jgi:hypothetical protein
MSVLATFLLLLMLKAKRQHYLLLCKMLPPKVIKRLHRQGGMFVESFSNVRRAGCWRCCGCGALRPPADGAGAGAAGTLPPPPSPPHAHALPTPPTCTTAIAHHSTHAPAR